MDLASIILKQESLGVPGGEWGVSFQSTKHWYHHDMRNQCSQALLAFWLQWLPCVHPPKAECWELIAYIFREQKCSRKCQKPHLHSFIIYAGIVFWAYEHMTERKLVLKGKDLFTFSFNYYFFSWIFEITSLVGEWIVAFDRNKIFQWPLSFFINIILSTQYKPQYWKGTDILISLKTMVGQSKRGWIIRSQHRSECYLANHWPYWVFF